MADKLDLQFNWSFICMEFISGTHVNKTIVCVEDAPDDNFYNTKTFICFLTHFGTLVMHDLSSAL